MNETEAFEQDVFRLEMENNRLVWWLNHIAKMKDHPAVNLREAAYNALAGDAAERSHND